MDNMIHVGIPSVIYEKLVERAWQLGFNSVEELILFLCRTVAWASEDKIAAPSPSPPDQPDAQIEKRLRDLGYIE